MAGWMGLALRTSIASALLPGADEAADPVDAGLAAETAGEEADERAADEERAIHDSAQEGNLAQGQEGEERSELRHREARGGGG